MNTDLGGLEADATLVSGYVLLHEDTADTGKAALTRGHDGGADVDAASLAVRTGRDLVLEWMANANVIFADEQEAEVLTGLSAEAAASTLAASHEVAW